MISKQIENIILQDDFRGMKNLKEFMPKDYLSRSSDLLLQSKGEILIVSGFYILNSKSPETDGPPGAVAISSPLRITPPWRLQPPAFRFTPGRA